jgi:hypothetical protein
LYIAFYFPTTKKKKSDDYFRDRKKRNFFDGFFFFCFLIKIVEGDDLISQTNEISSFLGLFSSKRQGGKKKKLMKKFAIPIEKINEIDFLKAII